MLRISYVDDGGTPQLLFEGDVSAAQSLHAFDAVISEPEFTQGVGLVIDATGHHHSFSRDEVQLLARHMAEKRESLGNRLAVVVSPDSEFHYGLARMFSIYAELGGLAVGVFTATEEALRWLLTSPDL